MRRGASNQMDSPAIPPVSSRGVAGKRSPASRYLQSFQRDEDRVERPSNGKSPGRELGPEQQWDFPPAIRLVTKIFGPQEPFVPAHPVKR